MPQNFKKPKSTSTTSSSSTKPIKSHNTSRKTSSKTAPHRIIKPQKPTLAAQRKLTRKAAAGLTAQLEKRLAEKAGHVELLLGKGVKTDRRREMLGGAGAGDKGKGKGKGSEKGAGSGGGGGGAGRKGPTGKSVG